jgi:hypothetical protein
MNRFDMFLALFKKEPVTLYLVELHVLVDCTDGFDMLMRYNSFSLWDLPTACPVVTYICLKFFD